MLSKKFFVDAIIVLVVLIFLGFFSQTLLPFSYVILIATGVVVMFLGFLSILFKEKGRSRPLDKIVLLFIFSMIVSSVMANMFWQQSFASSLKAYQFFYIYFLYFILVFLKISPERVQRIIILLFFITLIIFFIDFITFPNPLFAERDEERRNGITIFFFGQGFTFLGAFYFLNKFFYEKKVTYLIWFVLSFLGLFFLTQSRMNLLALILGSIILLISSRIKIRYLITLFIIIAGGLLYSYSNIFNGIKEENKNEVQFYKENVRVLAQDYFLNEMQAGGATKLFGNGFPGEYSDLGLATEKGNSLGYWTADIGMVGIYSYFGLIGVLIWLLFFYLVFKMKNNEQSIFLKAYFLTLLTTAITGYSIFDPGYMPATVLALYLAGCEYDNQIDYMALDY